MVENGAVYVGDEPGEIRSVGLRRGLSVDPYADVLLGCVRQLEAGITATMHLDSNYGGPPELYEQRLSKIIHAYRTSGIRFSVGVGIRDQNTFGPYVGDEVFLARLPPEAQAEVAQWEATSRGNQPTLSAPRSDVRTFIHHLPSTS